MNIINCTPHEVRLNDGRVFPPSGIIPRVSTSYVEWKDEGGVPTTQVQFGEVQNLPAKKDDTLLIVSGLLASACPDRDDLITPATGHPEAVRKDGQIYSVPGFTRNH